MLKILLWFVSNDVRFLDTATKILERQHNGIEIVGVTANVSIKLQRDGKNLPFVLLSEVAAQDFDVLLVVGAKKIGMSEVVKLARRLNLPDEKLLGDWIVCVPGFTLDKYRRLQRSRLSIISRQCFGGCISNLLGLPFLSPFVNLFMSYGDFMKILRAPQIYMAQEPHFEKWHEPTAEEPKTYPILSLGSVSLKMLHYKEIAEAITKWNERKTRINRYNLLVVTAFQDDEFLREFDALSFGKKVCFVPFKSDLDSAWYIKPGVDNGAKDFIDTVNRFGWGKFFYYDLFDMLLYGKKTPLIEM